MKYLQRSFTCPASSNTSQEQWDRAFLTPKEFKKKYGKSPKAEVTDGD